MRFWILLVQTSGKFEVLGVLKNGTTFEMGYLNSINWLEGFFPLPSRKLTANAPDENGPGPKKGDRLLTIRFQVLLLLVLGRVLGGSSQLASG